MKKLIPKKLDKKGSNEKIKKSKKNVKKHISIFLIMFVLLIIVSFIGVYFGIRYIIVTLKYKQYTDKMNLYGYNELYNNSKATSNQKVTNDELIKVAIGSLMNSKDIKNIYYLATDDVSDIQNWQNYSKYIGVNNNISDNNLKDNSTKMDAILILTKTIEGIINTEIEQANLKIKRDILDKYSEEEQKTIAKAVTLGIIKNKNSSLTETNLLKGELNMFIIQLVEKYATIYYKNAYGQVSANLITKKQNLPSNYKEYPYVIDSISKETYQQGFKVEYEPFFKSPKELYKTMGYLYNQTDYTLSKYLQSILNIDWETIKEKDFLEKIKNEVAYEISEEDIKLYIQYVKDNKIKLEGSATVLIPIMYNTGEGIVVRTKIELKIINSDTQYNLLFGDENQKIKYMDNEIVMYVDVPLGGAFNSNTLFVNICCLSKQLSEKTTSIVIEE